jgi:hypothetical protein
MASLGIKEAFSRYGASLVNVLWSVSAWAPDGALVVSLWDHHRRKGLAGTLEFAASASRWKGPGNSEFRENVKKAFESGSKVYLVIVRTEDVARVEAGDNPRDLAFHHISLLNPTRLAPVVEWWL